MTTASRIPEATIREEWAVAVTQLWARALGGAVERNRVVPATAFVSRRTH